MPRLNFRGFTFLQSKKAKPLLKYFLPRAKSSGGFTLVEVMTAITVLAIAAAVVVPNLRKFSQDQELIAATTDLKYALRTAQSNAASRVRCPNNDKASKSWSVVFTNSSYQLQAECSELPNYEGQPKLLSGISLTTFCNGTDIPLKFMKNEVEYPPDDPYACINPFTIRLTSSFSSQQPVCIKVDKGGAINEVTCP